ncbi:MAG TPA: DUF4836 family protein [Saprospiraceae bacterium]|nr:DUF4836 family protein [Saprospiraceae bacterium]HMQ83555.1 DUF4836 family protein [Saprospiraceae bacterium]
MKSPFFTPSCIVLQSIFSSRITYLFLLYLLLGLLLASCQSDTKLSSENEALSQVSGQATMVNVLNLSKLMEKADWESLKNTEGFRNLLEEAHNNNPVLEKILLNPAASGLDLEKNAFIALDQNEQDDPLMAFTFAVKDVALLEALLREANFTVNPASQEIYSYAQPGKKSAIAWNDEVLIIGAVENGDAQERLKTYTESLKKQSAAQIKSLRKALNKGDHDIVQWISADMLLQEGGATELSKFLGFSEADLKENGFIHYLTFEEGLVKSEASFELSKKIKNDLSILFNKKAKTDFSKLVPAQQPAIAGTASLNLNGVNQLLIEKYSQGFAEQALQSFNLSTDQLLKALDGEMFFGLYPEGDQPQNTGTLLAMTLKDKSALKNVFEQEATRGNVEKIGDGRYQLFEFSRNAPKDSLNGESESFSVVGQILFKNNVVYVSSKADLLDQIANGQVGFKNSGQRNFQALTAGQLFALMGDLQALKVLSGFKSNLVDGFNLSGNLEEAAAEIHLNNQNQNSLKSLLEAVEKKDTTVIEY